MAMHLGECATFVTIIIGRWKSIAFMKYIREEIAQVSKWVSWQAPSSFAGFPLHEQEYHVGGCRHTIICILLCFFYLLFDLLGNEQYGWDVANHDD
jgi:hypothetical protein